MKLSIVIPIYNEAANIPNLIASVTRFLDTLEYVAEVILVDDGSLDGSFELLKQQVTSDERFRCVRFTRNYGQTAAMAAGFDLSSGEIVVPMDADLQNNPEDIPKLLAKIDEGYDVVSGWRKDRKDKMVTRRVPSVLANALISRMTHVKLHDYGCTLKAYRRNVLEQVRLYGELHRFVPALAYQFGARVTEVPVGHRARQAGESKYGIDRTMRVVLDLMTVKFLLKYATRPLQLFGKWAIAATGISFLTFLVALYMKFAEGLSMNRNPLLILSAFLLFAGVQFVALGLLGELVTRAYHEIQAKPIYSVREKFNF